MIARAESAPLDRVSADVLDVVPPSARVSGPPGKMTISQGGCRTTSTTDVRRKIVNVATQEWGYFGFSVVDQTSQDPERSSPRSIRRPPRLAPWENLRVADSIAGYWTVTPDGSWILERQNRIWSGPSGPSSRWRDPWSAAFISWVMCEGGLGETDQFRRSIAHYVYIDQAIEARDDGVPDAAFEAYDVGEADVEPGDLLCTARRSAYRTLDERREHLGIGARTHCDIVVKVDESNERFLAIGGNVRGSVRLKLWPAFRHQSGPLQPEDQSMIPNGRAVFAHLKLRAEPIEPDALDNSPTLEALDDRHEVLSLLRRPAGVLVGAVQPGD
ncbi:MAG: DUF2272 domain-containing protein [Candidatus Rariloculaceae bacterium]